jgi:hypothetical protein
MAGLQEFVAQFGTDEPAVRSAREPGYALRYVYIERSWEEPPRLAIFVERIKYSAARYWA